ncbi:MAG: response regulator transcription factor [Ruminococcus sp.]|nr:response regulator transcription factor [Ruminococcus sp.]
MIKIIIADDVRILRTGLKAIFMQADDIEVVGEAENGQEAFEMCVKLHPDVVLMDMRMPDFDGGFGIKKIKSYFKDIRVLVLTTFDDKETVEKAVASGADGYILKEMDSEKIINSIRSVADGITVFCDNVFRSIRMEFYSMHESKKFDLTERERDFLRLICEGCDNREIASRLFLAEGTVRNGISRLLEKLSLKDRTQLAVFAIKNNIIQED